VGEEGKGGGENGNLWDMERRNLGEKCYSKGKGLIGGGRRKVPLTTGERFDETCRNCGLVSDFLLIHGVGERTMPGRRFTKAQEKKGRQRSFYRGGALDRSGNAERRKRL